MRFISWERKIKNIGVKTPEYRGGFILPDLKIGVSLLPRQNRANHPWKRLVAMRKLKI
jgi:hypothetical protein